MGINISALRSAPVSESDRVGRNGWTTRVRYASGRFYGLVFHMNSKLGKGTTENPNNRSARVRPEDREQFLNALVSEELKSPALLADAEIAQAELTKALEPTRTALTAAGATDEELAELMKEEAAKVNRAELVEKAKLAAYTRFKAVCKDPASYEGPTASQHCANPHSSLSYAGVRLFDFENIQDCAATFASPVTTNGVPAQEEPNPMVVAALAALRARQTVNGHTAPTSSTKSKK